MRSSRKASVDIESIEAELAGAYALAAQPAPRERARGRQRRRTMSRISRCGEFREFDFEPKPHWELGPALGIIDFERGVKLSGSRYYVLKGWGARLQRALISFLPGYGAGERLHRVVYTLHRACDMLYGSAQFPKFQDTVYGLADGDKYPAAHGRGRRRQSASRRDSGRSRAAAELCGAYALLPQRESQRRARCARHQARASIRKSGDVQIHHARNQLRRTRGDDASRRKRSARNSTYPTAGWRS